MKHILYSLAFTLTIAAPAFADDHRPIRGLRETVGSVQITGWERGLVQGNPNLSHWCWTPIYANIQRIRNDPEQAQAQPQPRTPPQPEPVAELPAPGYNKFKPIQLPMPVPEWRNEVPKYLSAPPPKVATDTHANSQVSAKMMPPRVPVATVPVTETYGFDYTKPKPQSSTYEKASVHGKLTAFR